MIYTKTGDQGATSLANGQRVSKADARIEAYGTVDELNSWIGLIRSGLQRTECSADLPIELEWIQHRLFNLGALLSEAPGEWITAEDVKWLEDRIDEIQALVPRQQGFILPAGNETVCRCHIARTVCRRAERRMIEAGGSGIPVQFINRLSDYLFVLARLITHTTGTPDETWKKDFFVEKLTEK